MKSISENEDRCELGYPFHKDNAQSCGYRRRISSTHCYVSKPWEILFYRDGISVSVQEAQAKGAIPLPLLYPSFFWWFHAQPLENDQTSAGKSSHLYRLTGSKGKPYQAWPKCLHLLPKTCTCNQEKDTGERNISALSSLCGY